MDAKMKEQIEEMMEEGNLGYAYLYTNDIAERQEFVFRMTPKNIANFLGSHFLDARKMILTDLADRLILDTCGGFVDNCPDQELLHNIIRILAPIQMGEVEAVEFPIITKGEYDEYGRWEDEQVTMAEITMG